jgi:hypothetical protein
MVSRVWDISSGIGPCFSLAGRLRKFYANAAGKRPMQRKPLLMKNKQQANTLLSMHNSTPLVIRQCKLALTARNTLFALYNH